MAQSDLIVVWGGNPVSTQVNVMHHVTRARKQRGAKLVVIDPYRSPTAAVADLHLAPRPGTDGALACAVMHVAFRDGHADRDYMARFADCPAALEAHLATRGPAWAAAITGLSVAEIEDFARLYGTTRRAYIRAGYGFARSRNGAANMHAVTCLPTVTGAWQHPGGGALWSNRGLYHWDKTLIEGLDARDLSIRELDMSRIGSVLTGDRTELGDGPPVHGLLIQNQNPVTVCPDSHRVRRGFAREDLFVCTHEQFLTETARWSDIVLPATMFLEHDDLYQAGGHSHIQIGPKLIEPPGECRSNHEVLQGLAARLGRKTSRLRDDGDADHRCHLARVGLAGCRNRAARALDRCLRRSRSTSAFARGVSDAGPAVSFCPRLGRAGQAARRACRSCPTTWRRSTSPAKRIRSAWSPRRRAASSTPASPRWLRRAGARDARPCCCIRRTRRALGIAEGARVRLGNARGEVVLHARLADGMQPGVLVAESIWPSDCFEGGIGINALTSDDPGPPSGGAVFHDTAVWLRAAAADLPIAAE